MHVPKYAAGPLLEDANPMTISLILHIDSNKKVDRRILKMIEDANIIYRNANISISISEIIYDSPNPILIINGGTKENRKLYQDIVDEDKSHKMHIFFMEKIVRQKGSVSGLHVAPPTQSTCRSMIFINDSSKKNTLAHEIGHVLKLEHRKDEENIMFSGPRTKKEHFNVDQMKKIRNRLKRRQSLCRN